MDFSDELLLAIDSGWNDEVKSLIEETHLHHLFDTHGTTLLHYSASVNNVEITKYLLDCGCPVDIQTRNEMGYTPLMLALNIDDRHYPVVQVLLDAGADIEMVNTKNTSALEMALRMVLSENILQAMFRVLRKKYPTSEGAAQRLIDANCNLRYAVYTKDAKIIECMLKRGSTLVTEDLDYGNELHAAVMLSDAATVEVLLKHGANVLATDLNGANPLFYLYENAEAGDDDEKLAILQSLLSRGVSLASCTRAGHFQMTSALVLGSREIVRKILDSMGNLDARDQFGGRNVLHYLAHNTRPGVVEELKPYSESLNVYASDNLTASPMFWAVSKGNVDMVEFLLEQGAEANDYFFYSCSLTFAAHLKDQHDRCAELLLQFDADPRVIQKRNGQTFTIFDSASRVPILSDRMNLAVARLAILDKLGETITDLIRSNIDSHRPFKVYFEKCKRVLDEKIFGTVTLCKLLTSSKRQTAKYLKNDELVLILSRIEYNSKVKRGYRFYYNLLKKRVSSALVYKTLTEVATKTICKLVDKNVLIADKIIDYLTEQDLWQLCRLYEDFL